LPAFNGKGNKNVSGQFTALIFSFKKNMSRSLIEGDIMAKVANPNKSDSNSPPNKTCNIKKREKKVQSEHYKNYLLTF
jgi:hypothetical protein